MKTQELRPQYPTTFTRAGAITLNSGENSLASAVIDPVAGFAYFGTAQPSVVVKVHLFDVGQKDLMRATRFSMWETGLVSTVHFYSHMADGHVRLAIYDDGATTRTLLWQSDSLLNGTAGCWFAIPISTGMPGALTLSLGNYWLAWQVDTPAHVASYTPGNLGDSFLSAYDYGPFPAGLAAEFSEPTDERWSEYITYDRRNSAYDWLIYD